MATPSLIIPVERRLREHRFLGRFARWAGCLGAVSLTLPLHAVVTGQWDFNNSSTPLAASVGQALEYHDGPSGQTSGQSQFDTTTALGIPDIAGVPARVMRFPRCLPTMGYRMSHGSAANGGGLLVNQWTVIMDVLFPAASSGQWRALIQTDTANPANNDAEFYLNESNGLGINGIYTGNVPPNTWVRLAIAVDLAASPPVIAKYINGSKVGEQSGTRDGRFALTPNSFALLFTDGYAGGIYTQPGYLNSLQVHNTRLSDAEIGSLGAPTADGIPTEIQPKPFVKSLTPTPGQTDASPELAFAAVIADGTARLATNTIQLHFDGGLVTPSITRNGSETTITYSAPGLLAAESTHQFVLTYADEGQPPARYTNAVPFAVARYVDLKLPAPFLLETFDNASEGTLPAGWTETHYTDVTNPQFDLGNLDSAAYATWVVVEASRFEGSFVTYSNPNNPQDWETDYQRVLSFNPANVVNGQVVRRLAQGRLVFGNSGYRNGRSQVLYLFSPDFDVSGQTNVYLSFHSLWEQNEDSLGAVEYSIDQGQTWLPLVYYLDGRDIVPGAGGNADAVATFNTPRDDIATYIDPATSQQKGGTYGAFLGATISSNLAPFISPRVDNDPVGSKRVELFRLPAADGQTKVRFRFAHAGTDSWYFGIDHLGLHSLATVEPPSLLSSPQDTTAFAGDQVTLTVQPGGVGPFTCQWFRGSTLLTNTTAEQLVFPSVSLADAGVYSVRVSNAGGSTNSAPVTLTVLPLPNVVYGVWNFDQGDLSRSAGVGTLDYANGPFTQGLTSFETTDNVSVPHIGGQPAKYMRVPAFEDPTDGYSLALPSQPVGAERYLNRYTLVWDLLIPAAGGWMPFFNTDPANQSDADFYVAPDGGLGIGALGYAPTNTIRGNTWYRIAFAANLPTGRVTYYVNGSPIYTRTGGSLADGRFALYSDRDAGPDLRLFNEGDNTGVYTQELLVNSLLFISRTLSASEIAALGGPSAPGITPPAEPLHLATPAISGASLVLTWSGGRGPFQVQKATRLVNADWQNLGAATSQNTFSDPIGGGPTFYRVQGQ